MSEPAGEEGTTERGEPLSGSIWGGHELPEGEEKVHRIGPLLLRWVREGDEIRLAYRRPECEEVVGDKGSAEGGVANGGEGEVEWSRFATPPGEGRIRLVPLFPDRPLVVTPEESFHLLPGSRVRIFVRVPLWVRLELDRRPPGRLLDLPTVILSDTWFGDVMEGELCYFLPTTARRAVRDEHLQEHLAVCPVVLENRSDESLPVEELAFRCDLLSLFRERRGVWADETRIRYRGSDAGSEVAATDRAPSEARDAIRLSGPRGGADRSLRSRTFSRLRSLSGLGEPGGPGGILS